MSDQQLMLQTAKLYKSLAREDAHLFLGCEKFPLGIAAMAALLVFIAWSHAAYIAAPVAGVIVISVILIARAGNRQHPYFWRVLQRSLPLQRQLRATPTVWRHQAEDRAELDAEALYCKATLAAAPSYHF